MYLLQQAYIPESKLFSNALHKWKDDFKNKIGIDVLEQSITSYVTLNNGFRVTVSSLVNRLSLLFFFFLALLFKKR